MLPPHEPSRLLFSRSLQDRARAASALLLRFWAGLHPGRRQLLVFDRFLARITHLFGEAVTLKGGLVLELRLHRARTTKDIDLRMKGSADGLLQRLQQAGRLDLGEFLRFEVQPDARHPEIQADGLQYDGLRFRVTCQLAGKLYGSPFGLDIVLGEPMFGEPDTLRANDVLSFAGIEPPLLRLYPIETHIAEKLHAYTLPRQSPNTRVKDLPDLALLATAQPLQARRLRAALEQTFHFRATHPLPAAIPRPSEAWAAPYAVMALEDDLLWKTLPEVFTAVKTFLDPVLAAPLNATWQPDTWSWAPS